MKEADSVPVMWQAPLWVSLRSEQLPGGAVGGEAGGGAPVGGSGGVGGRAGAVAGEAGGRTGGGGSGTGWAPLRRDAASDRKWLARRAAVKEVSPGPNDPMNHTR